MSETCRMNRIGIDLGGTKIDAITLAPDGRVLFEQRIPTPSIYPDIIAAIRGLALAAGPGRIGIGSPGSESPVSGLWRNANLTMCNGRPFRTDLEAAIGRGAIIMENDANCLALSEARDGAGAGHSMVVFFTIGTALGGGLVIDGRLRHGPNREAGEFGHVCLPWPEEEDLPLLPCFCGKRGCVEQYVSGTGLARDYARTTGKALSGEAIVAAARLGEGQARAALGRLQSRFARLIGTLTNILDPDIFVVGGGLSALPELVEEIGPLSTRWSFSGTARSRVVRAHHGATSGARGAAWLT